MAGKEPCLCVPSCTKALGRVQRECHRKRVQAALGRASDSSDTGSPSSTSGDPDVLNSVPGDFYRDDGSLVQDIDLDNHAITFDNELVNDDYIAGTNSSDSEAEDTEGPIPPLVESEDENDAEEEEVEDEITDENLVQVLEERFGDQWREQMNQLRGELLTDADLDNISAFALRMDGSGLPCSTYQNLRKFFRHKLNLDSEYLMYRRIEFLSGVKPTFYDMCKVSCCLFAGPLSNRTVCPSCGAAHYHLNGKPLAQFSYLPIIPRIQAWYTSLPMIEQLKYRSRHTHTPGKYADVFNGSNYRIMLNSRVVLEGIALPHKYFSDSRDIAFGGSTDGFQIFAVRPALGKRKSNSSWPLILVNFNLPPEIRTRTENLIPLGVIPGPHSPDALDSFFFPFIEECKLLARGVRTYDAITTESFDLHAYLITFSGDLPAISKLLCLRGHGAYCPCRCCLIKGERIQGTSNTKYYPVLVPPRRRGEQQKEPYDPLNLPLRTRENLQEQLIEISQAAAVGRRDLGMEYGINRLSMFLRVPSIHFPQSFPHDIMHLFFENICPSLVDQWTGSRKFKGRAPVDPGFQIASHIWEQIGRETAEAFKTIPSEFVGAMPDITTSKYKAEYWSFWFQYLGPVLLRNRFPNAKYYRHYCDLVAIIKRCLQFTISAQEVDELEASIIKWVEEYERWYYGYDQKNLRACNFNIHALLHIPDYIRWCGPAWTTWAFPMERYCGKLGTRITSRLHPYATLAMYVKRSAQLTQLKMCYSRVRDLLSSDRTEGELTATEKQYEAFPSTILRSPRKQNFQPDQDLRRRISLYFARIYDRDAAEIRNLIPLTMTRWGKVRIANGGDKIRARCAVSLAQALSIRDSSFIRYTLMVANNHRGHDQPPQRRQIFYGQLDCILDLELPASRTLNLAEPTRFLLAVVIPCSTGGRDATCEVTTYSNTTTPIAIDLRTVECVVGRVQRGNEWGIIDRSGDFARTVFVDPVDDED